MRILFMGSPDFAVTCLEGIIARGWEVVGVITQDDKPAGRGYKIKSCAVRVYARENGIPVYEPESLTEEGFPDLKKIDPDLIAVVAYGKMLPQYILDYPRYGCINVHGSLLPKYRGASPIQQSVIDGCDKTGVTIQYMAKKMDTGDMIVKLETPILETDTAGTVHDKLALLGAQGLDVALRQIESGEVKAEKQDESQASYCKKIDNAMCKIEWDKPCRDVANKIRGLSPFPGAFTYLDGKILKIYTAKASAEQSHSPAGTIVGIGETSFEVACSEGVVRIEELQLEGKKRMSTKDYLRGRSIEVGSSLGICADAN